MVYTLFIYLFCVRSETGCGKFALRALSQCLAREFQPLGVHVAHVIIDGVIGPPRFFHLYSSTTVPFYYIFFDCVPFYYMNLFIIYLYTIYNTTYTYFLIFLFLFWFDSMIQSYSISLFAYIDSSHQRLRERWLGNNRAEEGTGQWTQTRWLKPTGTCMFRTGRLGPKRLISVPPIPDSSTAIKGIYIYRSFILHIGYSHELITQ
jgi:hypothetical protein